MHDLAIRNGRVIDGSGGPEYQGDIGIDGGTIAAVGANVGPARREIDAAGKLVTPGWIDMHTHFDAQVAWDPFLTPSCWNGVTTVVMGNCGVGFAPVHPKDRDWLMDLMDAVEDIPAIAMSAGMTWAWETFPEYLDAIDHKPRVMDILTQLPHCALRTYVMGERGAEDIQPTAAELVEMTRIVRQGIEAGAFGVSSNRLLAHRTKQGELIPGTLARYPEIEAIAKGAVAAGGGVLQFVGPFEREWLYSVAQMDGISVTYLMGEGGRETLDPLEEKAYANGWRVYPQVRGRGTMIIMNLEGSLHPYMINYAYRELVGSLPMAERLRKMRDPEVRARILASDWDLTNDVRKKAGNKYGEVGPDDNTFVDDTTPGSRLPWLLERIIANPAKVYVLGDPPDYEPDAAASVATYARKHGISADQAFYDLLTADRGQTMLIHYLEGYSQGNLEYMADMMRHPITRNGLSDAGAHVGAICDAHMPSWNLAFWGRDRTRGGKVPLETIVNKQTRGPAEVYGLLDRGLLQPGMRADVNVIDFERLSWPPPHIVYDLPENAKRFMQRTVGYDYTICNGEVVLDHDELTGALPGRLVRRPRGSS
jgi:N-acyl-D-aspartate/D-glutamate deacylase